MTEAAEGWQVRLLKPRTGLLAQSLRAAELGDALCEVMLAPRQRD
jgi:hypothetical protein